MHGVSYITFLSIEDQDTMTDIYLYIIASMKEQGCILAIPPWNIKGHDPLFLKHWDLEATLDQVTLCSISSDVIQIK